MAIVAYALKLVGSAKAVIILERLETLAASEGIFLYSNFTIWKCIRFIDKAR
jgi:hypothetical protein